MIYKPYSTRDIQKLLKCDGNYTKWDTDMFILDFGPCRCALLFRWNFPIAPPGSISAHFFALDNGWQNLTTTGFKSFYMPVDILRSRSKNDVNGAMADYFEHIGYRPPVEVQEPLFNESNQ